MGGEVESWKFKKTNFDDIVIVYDFKSDSKKWTILDNGKIFSFFNNVKVKHSMFPETFKEDWKELNRSEQMTYHNPELRKKLREELENRYKDNLEKLNKEMEYQNLREKHNFFQESVNFINIKQLEDHPINNERKYIAINLFNFLVAKKEVIQNSKNNEIETFYTLNSNTPYFINEAKLNIKNNFNFENNSIEIINDIKETKFDLDKYYKNLSHSNVSIIDISSAPDPYNDDETIRMPYSNFIIKSKYPFVRVVMKTYIVETKTNIDNLKYSDIENALKIQ
ncbi:hypothetical protein [Mesomycoplasma lagogenitalium]|uniref:Uncharacterized protein n=1 Tax=Mesomycoplasma lagogenitalium TaxID=171286 RepID=A0ABY8LU76_9BACT|nr:hypothetical protein [Mesomycoplasma lagogenitalium]WGI36784.1 hypothetical protein QEG99_00640 [Mesomycoplasma lagogenitalium]